jgi:DNA (cytosine-5)-methyltransferase 1
VDVVDLFAGIGGIRKGVELAGEAINKDINCVFTSEWDRFANQTYLANWPGEEIAGDITEVPEVGIPDHNLLLAGFPCQPFSQAGLKLGFGDTRGTLFHNIVSILNVKQPEAFLLENVKRLKTMDGGETIRIIMDSLRGAGDTGYRVYEPMVYHARDFNVPQNRPRVYIVGFRNDLNVDFQFPESPGLDRNVGDILEPEESVGPQYTISDRLWAGHQRRLAGHRANGNGFGYGLFNQESLYTNTISARYYKDGSEVLIEQPGQNPRKLTPRECARLQGFPDDYILPENVSDAQKYKQFGNSVCVPVIKGIAREIIPAILPHIANNDEAHQQVA